MLKLLKTDNYLCATGFKIVVFLIYIIDVSQYMTDHNTEIAILQMTPRSSKREESMKLKCKTGYSNDQLVLLQ